MKKISIAIMIIVVALSSCKKTPEVNLKYVDVERDLITMGTTTATVQCDYDYIATLKKAYLCYGEGENEDNFSSAEMRVVQNTLYVDLDGLTANTTYNYYYEFHNGFNSMRTALKTFKTEGGSGPAIILPTVVTGEVTEITTSSAKGSGEVTNDGGAEVTERGICWSINENPTLNDNHVAAGTGTGAFAALMSGLEVGTTYHVRAYATNEVGTAYGLDREFVTVGGGGMIEEYVDLCLPSGTLWATCNLGANSPEEFGDYYAWGETETKTTFTVGTYKYCNGDFYSLTKYCNDPSYGYNGFIDNLDVLLAEDDAVTVNLGENWCMPTKEQWQELFDNTDTTWTTQNGVFGLLLTSSCNSLFLPAAGHYNGNTGVAHDIEGVGSEGLYWSSLLDTNYPITSWMFSFTSNGGGTGTSFRYSGQSIRPVRKTCTPTPPSNVPEGAISGLFTINERGDQVYFSQGNLQYQASTNTWRFAENQLSFVGGVDMWTGDEWGNVYENGMKCDNTLASSTYDGWIDLFSWGTSGYHDNNDPYNIHFEPWETTDFTVSPEYNFVGYGPSLNMPSPDLTESSENYDWGIYNAISNGGNETNLWRTLSMNEWDYVLNSRNTTSGVRYVKATVAGYEGIVLLPDDWDNSYYNLNNTNSGTSSFGSNEISLTTWESGFEQAGAVFLLEAGVRSYYQNSVVYQRSETEDSAAPLTYWTTTHYGSSTARCLYVFDNSFDIGVCLRTDGRSVRLVQDAH